MKKPSGKPARLAGRVFGFLTVLRREGNIGKGAAWRCRCRCGNELLVRTSNLTCGNQKSCGQGHTIAADILRVASDEYRIWCSMRDRCHGLHPHKNYGGRGIQVYPSWRNSFEQFLSDMGPRPTSAHSIDRYPDNDGNYEPSNCRWATKAQQATNTRCSVRIEIDGKLRSLSEHLQEIGADVRLVRKRIRRGWSLEDALTKPRATWLKGRGAHLNEQDPL